MGEEAKISKAKELFNKYDLDGNGTIDKEEMVKVLTKLNKTLSREDCYKLFDHIDENRDGSLQHSEFVNWLSGKDSGYAGAKAGMLLDKKGKTRDAGKDMDASKKQKLRNKFAALDKNGNGQLEWLEVYDFLQKRYPNMSTPDLKFLYDCADKSNDGQIDFFELLDLIVTVPQEKAHAGTKRASLHPLEAGILRDDVKEQFEQAYIKEEKDQQEMMQKLAELSEQLQAVRDEDKRHKMWVDERQKIMREHYAKSGQLRAP
mmetsp:Transcript_106253/g.188927  ORF Transcript_106253/g.188927 Transcript_106253/m.188927 type:complete len:260 (-) Transcript_106253:60-839(-)|eukprot:CAMPEP_0197664768 /NCGR_PEP_ID=MMETSP1338-20131121/58842_1 /TAXON_ID=43686 ORGANISM="Pelagodinium beii, Strain RCC1491" /NCGR_SAMPLE_ID=MMETSP1338 /ASSEMBLY_ACC=CAM_ASM_000754 /LENGTH=259 /DNA_ID=CAMNT_0043243479 /DNA_START=79 /DNA_END=858 /DNA_ORIENTATION=-